MDHGAWGVEDGTWTVNTWTRGRVKRGRWNVDAWNVDTRTREYMDVGANPRAVGTKALQGRSRWFKMARVWSIVRYTNTRRATLFGNARKVTRETREVHACCTEARTRDTQRSSVMREKLPVRRRELTRVTRKLAHETHNSLRSVSYTHLTLPTKA